MPNSIYQKRIVCPKKSYFFTIKKNLFKIFSDVKELEKNMSITQRELDKRLATPANATTSTEQQKLKSHQNQNLSDFATRASDIVSKMKNDAQNAQNAFKDCAEYFGEDPKIIDCSTFFGYFMRLISQFFNFPNSPIFSQFFDIS